MNAIQSWLILLERGQCSTCTEYWGLSSKRVWSENIIQAFTALLYDGNLLHFRSQSVLSRFALQHEYAETGWLLPVWPFQSFSATKNKFRENWWLEFTYLHNIIDSKQQVLFAKDQHHLTCSLILAVSRIQLVSRNGYSNILLCSTTNHFVGVEACYWIYWWAFFPEMYLQTVFAVAGVIFVISSALNIFLVYHFHWPANLQFVGARDPEMTNVEWVKKNFQSTIFFILATTCPTCTCPRLFAVKWVSHECFIIRMLIGLHYRNARWLVFAEAKANENQSGKRPRWFSTKH